MIRSSDATQYAKDNQVNLVLVIPKGYEKSLTENDLQSDHPDVSVTLTYVHDPSSVSVVDKMQILEMVFSEVEPGADRNAAVHQNGDRIDTHPKIPVH